MPSLFRFLTIVGTIGAVIAASLYIMAVGFEPELKEEAKAVPGLKIHKE